MSNPNNDHYALAITEAKLALAAGTYPVGAVLIINNQLVDKTHNQLKQNQDRVSHAEMRLLSQYSPQIKLAYKNKEPVVLITTLEPCLMCLGAAVMHKLNKIIYLCPDPAVGAAKLDPQSLHQWYVNIWPQLVHDTGRQAEIAQLMVDHLEQLGDSHYKDVSLDGFKALANSTKS